MKSKCTCPCHKGAGVIHYREDPNYKPDPIKLNEEGQMTSYSSSSRMIQCPCPCALNIKIAELTKEYYGSE